VHEHVPDDCERRDQTQRAVAAVSNPADDER
jgi:hypothetical protein